jgi:hypothetical protein
MYLLAGIFIAKAACWHPRSRRFCGQCLVLRRSGLAKDVTVAIFRAIVSSRKDV